MVIVLASIRLRKGKRDEYQRILKTLVPEVRTEKGCIEYVPAVDVDANIAPQVLDPDLVTILEKWRSMDALRTHLGSRHMLAYRETVKDIVESVSVKVLEEL